MRCLISATSSIRSTLLKCGFDNPSFCLFSDSQGEKVILNCLLQCFGHALGTELGFRLPPIGGYHVVPGHFALAGRRFSF